MTDGQALDVGIQLELGHARSAHRAAQLLRDAGLYNDALNRLYYALYHVVTALLLSSGVEPRRHRALPGLLGTHFAHALGPAELAAVARAATWRDLADYERTWQANAEVTAQAFAEIEPLMARLHELLDAGASTPR
ncbi:MAG TPA: HEPN domain-containing protein, partial [Polyangiaceae bacterium]|nr:HEPN domain-containing protein [Polyangiaceae bacterium]